MLDFDQLAREFAPRLKRYFYGQGVPEDSKVAEDLVQDTLIRAWRARHGFRGDVEVLPSWMFAIAASALKEHWRRVSRARKAGVYFGEARPTPPRDPSDEWAYAQTGDQERNPDDDNGEGSQGDTLTPEMQVQRERAIAALWPDERQALQMRLAGSTERQIAAAMKISRPAARTLLGRAARSLQQDLSREVQL